MSLLILLWTVLGGITSDQRGYHYYWTYLLATQIQSHVPIHILFYNLAPPIPQWNRSIKTDCASSLIKLII